MSQERSHRRVSPAKGVTFESLFASYEEEQDGWLVSDSKQDEWLNAMPVGAERDAWEDVRDGDKEPPVPNGEP